MALFWIDMLDFFKTFTIVEVDVILGNIKGMDYTKTLVHYVL